MFAYKFLRILRKLLIHKLIIMRNFTKKLLIITVLAIATSLVSCVNPNTESNPSMQFSAEVESWSNLKVTLTTTAISEYAYKIAKSSEGDFSNISLFLSGETGVPTGGTEIIDFEIGDLERGIEYTIHLAGKYKSTSSPTGEAFYQTVFTYSFVTPEYTEDICVVKHNYDGGHIRFVFPEDVKKRGNKIKWGVIGKAMYNDYYKNPSGNYATDPDIISHMNDGVYPAYLISRDTLITIDEEHMLAKTIYEGQEYEIEYYAPIAPGEPLVFLTNEVLYYPNDYVGWGPGWYGIPFRSDDFYRDLYGGSGGGGMTPLVTRAVPNEDDYWVEGAFHKRIEFTTKAPSSFDGKVKIETSALTTKSGQVTFTPDEKVYMYAWSLLDEATYNGVIDACLDGDPDNMQWFITSYYCMVSGLCGQSSASEGPVMIYMEDYFLELIAGGKYYVCVTAVPGIDNGDATVADLTKQSFQTLTFPLPDYTLPTTKVVVSPVESKDPFSVSYNIRCTNPDEAPVATAKYICNYIPEWNEILAQMSYSEVLDMYGAYFNKNDINMINSPEGLTISIPSREDAVSRLAVKAWNSEGRISSCLIGSNPTGVADSRSPAIPDAERIESKYFTSLAGDWTATATVKYKMVNEDSGEVTTHSVKHSTKVTIGEASHPATLSEDIYEIFKKHGVSREKTDEYFAEFKELNAAYNKKVRGQNRILCQGFNFDVSNNTQGRIATMSPWNLFTSDTYNSSTDMLFWDFGPKWYLQVAKDGSLFVPVNVNRLAPLSSWSGTDYHLAGLCEYLNEDNEISYMSLYTPLNEEDMNTPEKWPNLPVEVSEDGNTLTIKPYLYKVSGGEYLFYPNIVQYYAELGGIATINNIITEDVVLTRGWTDPTPAPASLNALSSVARNAGKSVASANGATISKRTFKGRTPFIGEAPQKREAKVIKAKAVTLDEARANFRKAMEERKQKLAK